MLLLSLYYNTALTIPQRQFRSRNPALKELQNEAIYLIDKHQIPYISHNSHVIHVLLKFKDLKLK